MNMVDPDGRTIRIWYYQDGDLLYFTYSGEEDESTIPDNDYVNAVIGAYKYNKHQWMAAGFNGESPSTTLVENKDILVNVFSKLEYDTQYYRGNGGIQNIIWNPYEGSSTDEGYVISPATIFAHEADHAIDDAMDAVSHSARVSSLIEPFGNEEERRVITGSEQKSAIANGDITRGQVTRRNHRGKTIYTISPVSPIIDLEATRYFRNHYKR